MDVRLIIAATYTLNLPSGSEPNYHFWLTKGGIDSPTQVEPLGQNYTTFLNVEPGDYVGSCVLFNTATGQRVGPVAQIPILVPDPGIDVDAPSLLSFTITP
jgi:hypothetical protein